MDSITPYTMALIAKYIARHRLRETRLLDTIADFLVKKGEYLDSKVKSLSYGGSCCCLISLLDYLLGQQMTPLQKLVGSSYVASLVPLSMSPMEGFL